MNSPGEKLEAQLLVNDAKWRMLQDLYEREMQIDSFNYPLRSTNHKSSNSRRRLVFDDDGDDFAAVVNEVDAVLDSVQENVRGVSTGVLPRSVTNRVPNMNSGSHLLFDSTPSRFVGGLSDLDAIQADSNDFDVILNNLRILSGPSLSDQFSSTSLKTK